MAENKYSVDLEALIKAEDKSRKEERRKKHKKDRVVAWIFFAFFLCILAGGLIFGVVKFADKLDLKWMQTVTDNTSKNPTTAVSAEDELNGTLTDILDSEEDIHVSIPEITEPEPTEAELFEEAIVKYVDSMSLQDKVAGLFVVTLEQLTKVNKVTKAGNVTKAALEKYPVGGIIFTAQNITKDSQFREMVTNLKEYTKYPLFLGIDEESGNTVLANKLKLEKTMTAAAIGDTMNPGVAYDENEKIAKYLSDYGLNLNIGLVGEALPSDTSILGNRAYGQDPVIVGQMISLAVSAYEDSKIASAVKFFPGQGGANQDTNSGMATTERTKEEFAACEVECFKKAVDAGGDIIIVSHVYAPNLTDDNLQCSRSKYVMSELIRNEMGLTDVIVMTDAMNKPAITDYYESGESAVASIKAGADMVLMPADFEEAYNAVYSAVVKGVIAKERVNDALKRIYRVKFQSLTAAEIEAMISTENAEKVENTEVSGQ